MFCSRALLFHHSPVVPSIASKARKFKPPISTPASHARAPPVHPQPTSWVPPTGEAGVAQGTLDVGAAPRPAAGAKATRAIPKATPFGAPRGSVARRGEHREPPAVQAARKKSVAERNVWESYLVLNWRTRLYLWLGLGAFALVGLYGGDYIFPETEEEKAARGEIDPPPSLAPAPALVGEGAPREMGGVGAAAGKGV